MLKCFCLFIPAHQTNGISSISLLDPKSNQPCPGPHPANTHAAGTLNASPLGVPPLAQGLRSAAISNSNKNKKLPPKQGMSNFNSPKLVSNAARAYPYSKPHSSPFPVAPAIPNPVLASSTAITDSVKKNISGDGNSFESLASLVTPKTMQAIRMLGFPSMREIQARTIPALLQGKNLRYGLKQYPAYLINIFVLGTCLCT